MPVPPPPVDLVVLAGGRGSRLGGRDKAAIVVGGRTLLARILATDLGGRVVVVGETPVPEGVRRTVEDPPGGGPVAGIGAGLDALARMPPVPAPAAPPPTAPPPSPTGPPPSPTEHPGRPGCPVGDEGARRGEATGHEGARRGDATGHSLRPDWVAVCAVDQPGAAEVLAALRQAVGELGDDVDAVCPRFDGRSQWLLAVYRRSALKAARAALDGDAGASVRALVSPLRWREVELDAAQLGDIDTPDDLERWSSALGG
ncbi:Molybdopterin-guanine dinucleotide biosynthesis protein MobA [Serinicoccus hydrothermalis]|uniref:Molybdopterin-guanine dinucleotide biosynthesis protein MobA n=1 Tax=Serinicoccus hydrothermalis TaxID=1758689 RepID=A0A1B1NDY0_9MICO|nr:NTP transferase domain-containing protein [Serinicoccus hydrothermalis]ANS79642.1 Molybdopterin-guanine dinucleotide biosynthesis protein MobA [Serinicoccus hydrothermalis]